MTLEQQGSKETLIEEVETKKTENQSTTDVVEKKASSVKLKPPHNDLPSYELCF